MLIWRVASAFIGIPLLLGATYLGAWPLAAATALIAFLATDEAVHLLAGIAPLSRAILRAWAVALAVIASFQPEAVAGLALPSAILMLFTRQTLKAMAPGEPARLQDIFTQGLAGIFAVVYPAFLLSFLAGLRTAYNYPIVWLVLGMVWATDTFAYFGGRLIGGPKLAPGLSPGKTVAGAVAGLAGAVIVGLGLGPAVGLGIPYAVGLAVLVGLAGQLGDLFESMIKRMAGVKDSGCLIPGHGGILDRFDSLAFALPVAYYFLILAGIG